MQIANASSDSPANGQGEYGREDAARARSGAVPVVRYRA